MGRFGFSEILILLVIALLLFGAGRIADIGKGLGQGIKNFKKGIADDDEPEPPKIEEKTAERAVSADAVAEDEKPA